MATLIAMPKLSDTMEEGVIIRWVKKEGETVKQGEVIAEVQTDKAAMELEAYDTGIMRKLFVPEGKGVRIGLAIAIIGTAGEDIADMIARAAQLPETKSPLHPENMEPNIVEEKISLLQPVPVEGSRRFISPLAKRIAEENGLDFLSLKGTGPGGRIIKRDIERLVSEHTQISLTVSHEKEEEVALSPMRKTIAKRLTESKTSIPHFYLTFEVNMKKCKEFRMSVNSLIEEKISYNDIVIKAAALALKQYPAVNASFAGEKIIRHRNVHLGVAVSLDDGLTTPVVRNADQKGIGSISSEIRTLAERARAMKLKPEEYTGSTFTISNLGMYGVDEFSAIINPPEAAILAVSAVIDKPTVENGQLSVAPIMKLTLSCDHRVIDGVLGASFMQYLKKVLENPSILAL